MSFKPTQEEIYIHETNENISNLPTDLIVYICAFLEIKELLSLGATNKILRSCICSKEHIDFFQSENNNRPASREYLFLEAIIMKNLITSTLPGIKSTAFDKTSMIFFSNLARIPGFDEQRRQIFHNIKNIVNETNASQNNRILDNQQICEDEILQQQRESRGLNHHIISTMMPAGTLITSGSNLVIQSALTAGEIGTKLKLGFLLAFGLAIPAACFSIFCYAKYRYYNFKKPKLKIITDSEFRKMQPCEREYTIYVQFTEHFLPLLKANSPEKTHLLINEGNSSNYTP